MAANHDLKHAWSTKDKHSIRVPHETSDPLQWRYNEHDGVSNESHASRLFACTAVVQAEIKEKAKALRYWPVVGAALIDDASTTSEWSTNILPT